jgi:hypothetical protein
MHTKLTARVFVSQSGALSREITQYPVFKYEYAKLQFWARAEIPYGKDGYSNIADLFTKLSTKFVHKPSSPLVIG